MKNLKLGLHLGIYFRQAHVYKRKIEQIFQLESPKQWQQYGLFWNSLNPELNFPKTQYKVLLKLGLGQVKYRKLFLVA